MPFRNSIINIALTVGLVAGGGASGPNIARADHEPVIVVPGRADVPIIIDGVDARGAVVIGDWGLYRPGFAPAVEPAPLLFPIPWRVRGYFPATGHAPRYGRLEIEPPLGRRLPLPARDFYRSWSTERQTLPASADAPFDPPPVIRAPRANGFKPRSSALPMLPK